MMEPHSSCTDHGNIFIAVRLLEHLTSVQLPLTFSWTMFWIVVGGQPRRFSNGQQEVPPSSDSWPSHSP